MNVSDLTTDESKSSGLIEIDCVIWLQNLIISI